MDDALDLPKNKSGFAEPEERSKIARTKRLDPIHHWFMTSETYREAHLLIGRTEELCDEVDQLAQENHTYTASRRECERYNRMWVFRQ